MDWSEYAARAFEPPRHAWPTPGHLARALDPALKQTPALDLIDTALVDAYEGRSSRTILSMPPQEGKSERATRAGALWLLTRNPDLRIAIASYESTTAARWGQTIRNDILANSGDENTLDLGLRLQPDSQAAARWQLGGHKGGIYSVGVGGALTGRAVDYLLIDDPVKGREQADSPVFRQRAWDWWSNVARTRLAPDAPVFIILTRWHEDDLAGRLIAQDADDDRLGIPGPRWKVINIPAQAGVDDPLGRAPGEWLLSARGRTAAQWEITRRDVGPRAWAALYQGHPTPPEGNLFHRAAIDANRVGPDQTPALRTVREYIDPAFSDQSDADETGRVVMGLGVDGCAYLLADLSERAAYDRVPIGSSHTTHGTTGVRVEQNMLGQRVLATVRDLVPPHVSVVGIPAKGTKSARAEAVSNLVDNNRVKFCGRFPELEDQLILWRPSTPGSPDRLDAFVHGVHDLLVNTDRPAAFIFDDDQPEVGIVAHNTFVIDHTLDPTAGLFDTPALAGKAAPSPYV